MFSIVLYLVFYEPKPKRFFYTMQLQIDPVNVNNWGMVTPLSKKNLISKTIIENRCVTQFHPCQVNLQTKIKEPC